MQLYKREMKSYMKSFIIWSVCTMGLFVFSMGMFPSFAAQGDQLSDLMKSFPEEFMKAFNMNAIDFTKTSDYMAYIIQYVFLALGIQGMLMGATVISKEEGEKTIEFLYSKPVKRTEIAVYKMLSVLTYILIMGVVYLGTAFIIMNLISDQPADGKIIILYTLSMILIQLLFASIGFIISMFIVNLRKIMPLSLGVVFGTYFLAMLSGVNEKMEFLKFISPFKFYDAVDVLINRNFDILYIAITAVTIVGCTLGTYYIYRKKDMVC